MRGCLQTRRHSGQLPKVSLMVVQPRYSDTCRPYQPVHQGTTDRYSMRSWMNKP
jgi:hypothetical protein